MNAANTRATHITAETQRAQAAGVALAYRRFGRAADLPLVLLQIRYGLPFGATVWASDYVILPAAKLYKPIWDYDAKTLANDLGAHLVYAARYGHRPAAAVQIDPGLWKEDTTGRARGPDTSDQGAAMALAAPHGDGSRQWRRV